MHASMVLMKESKGQNRQVPEINAVRKTLLPSDVVLGALLIAYSE
jgi:hypothetical protein